MDRIAEVDCVEACETDESRMYRAIDWLLTSRWPRRVLFAPVVLFPMGAARCLWHWRPSVWTALPMAVLAVWQLLYAMQETDYLMAWAMVGGCMNLAVVLRNNGRMPCVGKRTPGLHSVWVRAHAKHRWLWMADQKRFGYFSVGDFVIISALLWKWWR